MKLPTLIAALGLVAATGAAQAAAGARAWLDARLQTLSEGAGDPGVAREWYGEVSPPESWSLGDFEKLRWQAAQHIMALQKELGQ